MSSSSSERSLNGGGDDDQDEGLVAEGDDDSDEEYDEIQGIENPSRSGARLLKSRGFGEEKSNSEMGLKSLGKQVLTTVST